MPLDNGQYTCLGEYNWAIKNRKQAFDQNHGFGRWLKYHLEFSDCW